MSVDIEGFLHDVWSTVTLLDPAQRLSYNKILTLKSNSEYDVEDDVDVRFFNPYTVLKGIRAVAFRYCPYAV